MEALLLFCLIVVLVVRWLWIRERLERIENQLKEFAPTPVVAPPRPISPAPSPRPPVPAMPPAPEPARTRSTADWEATVGGNWLNKLGVLILVIGIALALGYSFTRVGPAGRVAISLAASVSMLAAGAVLEPRDRYRTFARGLLGGGWAALYFTVYAMHAVAAARILDDAFLAAALLAAVSAGMILHSLRYRSQTVTGLAYFIAFLTLGITEVSSFSLVALIPLAASLLYVTSRFGWRGLGRLGLAATWITCASRGDTGATLWQAQAVFAVYWLVFEGFDLLAADPWILPGNLVGFLGLSLLKWHAGAPDRIWQLLAATAVLYLAGALARARSGRWKPAITVAAGLAAAALWLEVDPLWLPVGLLIEAEILHLAGVALREDYLRILASPLFALNLADLAIAVVPQFPADAWMPAALANVGVLYGNRALRSADVVYGYCGLAVAALLAGYHAPRDDRGLAWMALAAVPFAIGWLRRQLDLRIHGYLLACLGFLGMAIEWPEPALSLGIGAALAYAAAASAHFSPGDRFVESEPESVRFAGAALGVVLSSAALWTALPPAAVAPAWAVLALISAAPWKIGDLRWQAYALAVLALGRCLVVNFAGGSPVAGSAAVIACFYAAQLWNQRGSRTRLFFSLAATVLFTALLFDQVSGSLLTIACGAEGVLLLAAGFPLRDRVLRLSGLTLLFGCILKLFLYDLASLETLPRIFSFIVLGVILVGVSWIYTRFRERIQRYL